MKHHGADILSACSSGGSTSSDRCVLYRFAALVNRLDWRLWNLDKKDIGALELYSVVIELQRRFDGISSKVRYPVGRLFYFISGETFEARILGDSEYQVATPGVISERTKVLRQTLFVIRQRDLPIDFIKLVLSL
jgi:hypothetical protein